MTRLRIWSAATAMLIMQSSVLAQVQGFEETFSGFGPYGGFDTPVSLRNIVPEFSSGRLVVEKPAGDPFFTAIRGTDGGNGSFRLTLDLGALSLGEVGESMGLSSLVMAVHSEGSGLLVAVKELSPVPDDFWTVQVGARHIDVPISVGTSTKLEVEYDHGRAEYTLSYDPNAEDEIPPLTFAPVALLNGPLLGELVFDIVFEFGESGGPISALLDSWTLAPFSNVPGDFNGNARLDASDLDLLSEGLNSNDPALDLTGDDVVNDADRRFWIHDLKATYFGDANLDGEFASSDLVNVFAAGEYEDEIDLNSTWQTGDWNGDGDFTTSDLVLAFQDGGYEQGPRVAPSLPEPMGCAWHFLAITLVACRRLTIR